MVRYRSRYALIADILEEALEGCAKTKIMYRANLNFLRFNMYFAKLSEKGLIKVVENPSSKTISYKTTKKGKELLRLLKKVERQLPNVG